MIHYCPSEQHSSGAVLVDGVPIKFTYAPNGIKVSTHTFPPLFESYKNSWGTMVASRAPRTSAKETSLLTSGHFP